jgi:mobilization protein bmgA
MIGSITKGSCFSGCVEYALALKEKNKEARLLYSEGLLTDTPKDIINGFECQRHLNSRVKHWCGHISLSYSPKDAERMSDEFMVKLALEYMDKMGIKNTQFIIAQHLDKEHPHCHIVYNRVDNDGKCVSDSFEYFRNNAICDELKRKYGLTYGENNDQVKTERLKGRPKTRQEIYLAVQAAKRSAKDWTTFQRELARKGITVRKKFRRGSTEVDGLSYFKDGQKFKASQVDRNGRCSYDVICKALDRNKNRQSQPASPSPKPMRQQPKQEPGAATKIIEAGADMVEGLGTALGGLFQVSPAYDPEEEAFINEMKRRQKRKRGRSV